MTRTRSTKFLAVVLVVLLVGVAIVGCSRDNNNKAPDNNNNNNNNDPWSEVDTVKITFASPYAPPQTYALLDEELIEYMKDISNGKIQMEYFPGGTLIGGREAAAELAQGVADFGWPGVGHSQHGYKLTNASLVWMYNLHPSEDVEAEQRIWRQIHEESEAMRNEYQGIYPYGQNAGGTSAWIIMREPIKSLADLRGKQIRATGAWAQVVAGLGAEPITMPMSETYMALERGTIDGTFGLPVTVLMGENFAEVTSFAMNVKINQSPYYAWAFNLDKWNSFPQIVRDTFNKAENWIEGRVVEYLQSEVEPAIQHGKKLGVEFAEISDEDLKTLFKVMDEVNRKRAAILDSEGHPATEHYERIQKLIEEYLATKK